MRRHEDAHVRGDRGPDGLGRVYRVHCSCGAKLYPPMRGRPSTDEYATAFAHNGYVGSVHTRGRSRRPRKVKVMEIISTAVAADILGVAPGTLRYWRYLDQGPRSFRVGRHVKYQRADIDAWLASQLATTARGGA